MVCPHCGTNTDVVNSRQQRRTNNVWRRRRCASCSTIFTTLEHVDLSSLLRVASTATELQPFSRDQLFISVLESCRHRPSAMADASNLTQQIITHLLATQKTSGLIDRTQIITITLSVLKTFDSTAATFYGAYHPA
jgi:transcriptional regulator NrdR family protein